MTMSPYQQLEQEFRRLHAFRGALSLLRWDAAVMMPRGSSDVRGEQLAALETEHHALLLFASSKLMFSQPLKPNPSDTLQMRIFTVLQQFLFELL